MERIQLPQILEDVKVKIAVLEQRLKVIAEGKTLYQKLSTESTDPIETYQYKELYAKKCEEEIVYTEQWKSQQHYLAEFKKDLHKQKQLRQQQLQHLNAHLQDTLAHSRELLQQDGKVKEQDTAIMKHLLKKFAENNFVNDDERLNHYRELITLVQHYSKAETATAA